MSNPRPIPHPGTETVPSQGVREPAAGEHVDFSRAVLEDLYRYPRRGKWIAWILWLLTGIMGGHRFYLERVGTGALMLLTGGGIGAWWMIDAFLLNGMIDSFNREQAHREAMGLPPVSLDFMPALNDDLLAGTLVRPPEWAARRGGRVRLAGDAFALLIAGVALGAVTVSVGQPEPLVAVVALIGTTLLGARWDALAHLPLLNGLDRWSHRLRLFYYSNDPGGPVSLTVRAAGIGMLTSLFRKRSRAEARLYLKLGAGFTIFFTAIDVIQNLGLGDGVGGLALSLDDLAGETLKTLLLVYAFASPIGAILTTHLLLERRDTIIWVLSGWTIVAMAVGMAAVAL